MGFSAIDRERRRSSVVLLLASGLVPAVTAVFALPAFGCDPSIWLRSQRITVATLERVRVYR